MLDYTVEAGCCGVRCVCVCVCARARARARCVCVRARVPCVCARAVCVCARAVCACGVCVRAVCVCLFFRYLDSVWSPLLLHRPPYSVTVWQALSELGASRIVTVPFVSNSLVTTVRAAINCCCTHFCCTQQLSARHVMQVS